MKTQTLSLGSSLHLTSSGLETCPGTLSESCTGHSGGMKTRGGGQVAVHDHETEKTEHRLC